MLRSPLLTTFTALAAFACAAPDGPSTLSAPALSEAEPVVAHLELGGVT